LYKELRPLGSASQHWLASIASCNARQDRGDLDGSIADYELAIKSDPFFAKAYGNRGLARLFQGDMAAAAKDFDQCLKLDPKLKPLLEEQIEQAKRRLPARQ
jgi:tetratricopeptide (TPR) repeat protein